MKKLFFSLVLLAAGYIANAQPPKVPADPGTVFGEKVNATHAVSVEQLYSQLQSKEDRKMEVTIKGTVSAVCQMEGCWIRVKSPDGNMMVRMKDHKFTVPVILDGKSVAIHGLAQEKITTVEQLRHYAEDAGKSKEEIAKITEPKKEIVMEAKGVLVL
ncbi:MAG TPA: DUF4920 domain-containing protein [Sediminibacterium sp.]|jgi:hypothetical protein